MADKDTTPQCESDVTKTETKAAEGKESSPKSSPSKIETNEALQHLVQGKRHLLVRDVNSAVNSLQEACRLLAEQYGETADPCGEAYFFYGKALLELSRIETGVLGNALDGVPDGDDADTSQTEDPDKLSEEERMKVVEEVDEALEENFITCEKVRQRSGSGKEADTGTEKVEDKSEKENGEVEAKSEETEKIVENGVSEKPSENGDKMESGDKVAENDEKAEDATAKADTEEMEVDGGAMSKAAGNATTAEDIGGLASGGAKQRQEAVEVATEATEDSSAKPVVAGGADGDKDGKTEVKPVAPKAEAADPKSEDKPASGETKDTDKKSVEKSAESVAVASTEKTDEKTEAKEASDATVTKKEAEDSAAEKAADDSTAEKASSDTATKASETTESVDKDGKDDGKPLVNGKKKGDSADGDEEEDEDGDEGEGEGVEEGAEKEEGEGETKEGDEEAEGDEADATKDGDTSQDCDTEEGDGEGDGAKEGDDDEEEDVPNIQLAWEVLELAKVIFTRQAKDKASDLKLSEVYQKLGEVSIEAENYTQAVDDLNGCLAIQKKHLESDDRLIAETHYHLGVAHSLANQYSEAIAAFQASVDTILARVQRLQRQILDREQGKKIEHEDPFYKEENEIKELEDLIPDMKEKIADMRDMKSEAQKKIAEIFAASGGAGPSGSSPAAPISPVKAMMTSRPATSAAEGDGEKKETHSIGHLVKRKRLSEPAGDEAKRTKQENGENGHNGVNGHAPEA